MPSPVFVDAGGLSGEMFVQAQHCRRNFAQLGPCCSSQEGQVPSTQFRVAWSLLFVTRRSGPINTISRNLVLVVRHKKVRSHQHNFAQLGPCCSSQEGQVPSTQFRATWSLLFVTRRSGPINTISRSLVLVVRHKKVRSHQHNFA